MNTLESLKEKYKGELRPFFEFLLDRRDSLDKSAWESSVKRLEESVIKTPDQYVTDIPRKDPGVFRLIIGDLFEDFISDNKNPAGE